MRVIIAGSRNIQSFEQVSAGIFKSSFNITEVICGMADGVDLIGKEWAEMNRIPVIEMPAIWRPAPDYKLNLKAGKERNVEMAKIGDALIAIWDGHSSGTKHMIKTMKRFRKPSYVYNPFEPPSRGLFDLI